MKAVFFGCLWLVIGASVAGAVVHFWAAVEIGLFAGLLAFFYNVE